MALLDPQEWLAEAAKQVKPLDKVEQSGGVYTVDLYQWSFNDLEDEIYGGENPRIEERPRMNHMGDMFYDKIDHGDDFDERTAMEEDMLPEVKAVAKKLNDMMNGEYFQVEKSKGDIFVLFVFDETEIPELQKYGILLPDTPMLSKIRANSDMALGDFEGPFMEGASVTVKMEPNPEGRQIPDPTSAELHLPDIDPKEAEQIKPSFTITVKQSFEDNTAMVKTYAFTFQVESMKFEPQPNGQVRPNFKAQLKEYKHA